MLKNNFSVANTGYHHFAPYMEYRFQHSAQNRRILGKGYVPGTHFIVFTGNNCDAAYFEEQELERFSAKTIETIIQNPSLIERIHREAFAFNDEYFELAESLKTVDLACFSAKKLSSQYKKLVKLQINAHLHAVITTWFVDCENQFSNYLMDLVRKLTTGTTLDATGVFSILTTPQDLSFQMKEEIAFLGLAQKASKDPTIKKALAALQNYSTLPTGLPAWFVRALHNHWGTWKWQPFGYVGPAHGLEHYIGLFAALFLEKKPIAHELSKRVRHAKKMKKQQDDLIKKLHIPPELQRTFAIARDIVSLKAYRKDCGFHGFFVLLEYFFPEISKRATVPTKHLWLYTNTEIETLLDRGIPVPTREIEARKKRAVFVQTKRSYQILSEKKAEEFLRRYKKMMIKESQERVDQATGSPAYPGAAKGAVRWVNTTADMPAMRQGDILFAHTTFPALLPAMKKAAAIVTEDGGITCHAAIVARELKIPCVTGIKNASALFVNGERVEVDASLGIVRRLSRSRAPKGKGRASRRQRA